MYLFRFQTIINGTHEEAQHFLQKMGNDVKSNSELASQLVFMKRLYIKSGCFLSIL